MAYDEFIADRIRQVLREKKTSFTEKKMIGGVVFMVDGKMLCGTHIDKKYGDSLLMVRIGEEAYAREKDHIAVLPMDFTGRPMKGYAFITPEGFDSDKDLERWVQLCLEYNPIAKASKKKK
jgi:hypothetical protein